MRTTIFLLFLLISTGLFASANGDDKDNGITSETRNNTRVLKIDRRKLENRSLKILAPNGKLIYQKTAQTLKTENTDKIEIKDSGIYWLLIEEDNHKVFERLIINIEPNEN